MFRAFFRIAGFCLLATLASAQTVTVRVSGVRSTEGLLRISFFASSREFEKETPCFEKSLSKAGMQNGVLNIFFHDIPPGRYGIAALDDENENGKLDYRWLLPAEGFGFSGYTLKKLRRPDFEEFQFDVGREGKTVSVHFMYW